MERVRYYFRESFPDRDTLVGAVHRQQWPFVFKDSEIAHYLGSARYKLPIGWKIYTGEDIGILTIPKWTYRVVGGTKEYRCTAVTLWSTRCRCEKSFQNKDELPGHCVCEWLLKRPYCILCGSKGSSCKIRLEINNSYLDKDKEVEESLSQDLCLCSTFFGHNCVCYCRYQRTENQPESNEDCSEEEQGERDSKRRRDNSPETKSAQKVKPTVKKAATTVKELQICLTVGVGGDSADRNFSETEGFSGLLRFHEDDQSGTWR
ncbi:hypothetical protein R1sor_021292 [Riccia sorocarpa]|uniref:Uncharacterized protein n=1 Tax=Riccia sorocarpa TaxID=122646 RepID=A0ABD3GI54_9MARC